MVRRPEAKLLKEHFVQQKVPVLAGMDQHMVKVAVAGLDAGRKPDDLRAGAEYGHNLELFQNLPSKYNWIFNTIANQFC